VLNPALAEMVARDRIAEMQRAAAKRSFSTRSYRPADTTALSIRQARRASPQRAIGWFLIRVGLRLALPRTRAGSAR